MSGAPYLTIASSTLHRLAMQTYSKLDQLCNACNDINANNLMQAEKNVMHTKQNHTYHIGNSIMHV